MMKFFLWPAFVASLLTIPSLPSFAKAPGFTIGCEGSQYIEKGRGGLDIKPSLNLISSVAGTKLRLTSCFRSQGHQDNILKRNKCRPRFGKVDCSGRVANVSQHTKTIAADIAQFAPWRKQCQLLAKGRSVAGGRGGVGTYPKGSGHFDMGPARSWNKCKGVAGGDDGSPKNPKVQQRLQQARAGGGKKCHPTPKYPSCCGPKRRARGLCQ